MRNWVKFHRAWQILKLLRGLVHKTLKNFKRLSVANFSKIRYKQTLFRIYHDGRWWVISSLSCKGEQFKNRDLLTTLAYSSVELMFMSWVRKRERKKYSKVDFLSDFPHKCLLFFENFAKIKADRLIHSPISQLSSIWHKNYIHITYYI